MTKEMMMQELNEMRDYINRRFSDLAALVDGSEDTDTINNGLAMLAEAAKDIMMMTGHLTR